MDDRYAFIPIPERNRTKVSPGIFAIVMGAISGATVTMIITYGETWLLGGLPAFPTVEGLVGLALFGALCGAGFVFSAMKCLTRIGAQSIFEDEPLHASGRVSRCVVAVICGTVGGAIFVWAVLTF